MKELLLLMLVSLISFSVISQEKEPATVLFIGNSYTYFWNLPQQVEVLGTSKGHSFSTKQSTSGGRNLGNHWKGERKMRSRELITEGDYNFVILQNHSMRALTAPDSMLFYGKKFVELAKKNGSTTLIYSTWSREWDPFMVDKIQQIDQQLAEESGATLVPVGRAWQLARQLRPSIDIYADDGSHPSALGSYLTACMFYGVLTRESPVGLTNRIQTIDAKGEKLYLNIQSSENALFCQKVAHQVLLEVGLIH